MRPACDAVVLAGGASRRFGTDKGAARWRDRRLVDHVVAALRPIAAEIILVTRMTSPAAGESPAAGAAPGESPADRVVFDDPHLPPGPLRGLVRGLESCRSTSAWVITCDAPLPQPALLEALHASLCESPDGPPRTGVVAVVPFWEGCLQPLMACYAVAAAAPLAAELAAGEQSPRRALERLGYEPFPERQCREYDPGGLSFLNVNTPQDLERLNDLVD